MPKYLRSLAILISYSSVAASRPHEEAPPLPPSPITPTAYTARATPPPAGAYKNTVDYFGAGEPPLTSVDKDAISLGRQWQSKGMQQLRPVAGPDGTVRFVFGASLPTVACAVLQVCDITLQKGELVNSINMGDTIRWWIEPAVTGSGETEVQHLMIKPMDVDLKTSLAVTTDRRTYHFRLISTRSDYMPVVSFYYPTDFNRYFSEYASRSKSMDEKSHAQDLHSYLDKLDFKYNITGDTYFTPVRVFNDGTRTILQMPATMKSKEAPALLVVRKIKGRFKESEQEIVNYRVHGDRYVVDSVFDRAILISGVGKRQERVTVTRVN